MSAAEMTLHLTSRDYARLATKAYQTLCCLFVEFAGVHCYQNVYNYFNKQYKRRKKEVSKKAVIKAC